MYLFAICDPWCNLNTTCGCNTEANWGPKRRAGRGGDKPSEEQEEEEEAVAEMDTTADQKLTTETSTEPAAKRAKN